MFASESFVKQVITSSTLFSKSQYNLFIVLDYDAKSKY